MRIGEITEAEEANRVQNEKKAQGGRGFRGFVAFVLVGGIAYFICVNIAGAGQLNPISWLALVIALPLALACIAALVITHEPSKPHN